MNGVGLMYTNISVRLLFIDETLFNRGLLKGEETESRNAE